MYKIGVSTAGKILNEETFAKIKASGIESIELSYGDYSNFDFINTKKLAKIYGIELWSLHLPFDPFDKIDPSAIDPEKRKYTFDNFLETIKRTSDIGIDKVIVHASAEPIPEEQRKLRLDSAAEFLSKLADASYKYGVTVAVEDLPRTCIGRNSEEINYLLSANNKLRACFDTNHLLNEKISDFIENVGNKIITLHVSDFDFVNERHWLPGEGDIDWLELAQKLEQVGYNGVWLYELGLGGSNTINRRVMTYDDLYKNATDILSGIKPAPIGKRIENLGFWGPI